MNIWQLTEYLLESKKVIDSIMFIDDNIESLVNLDLRNIIQGKLQTFYINLRVIYDKSLSKCEKEKLNNDMIYKDTLYHRDKKYAHKDDKYKKKSYKSRKELIADLKEKILHCYYICNKKLPENITFDFIPYDKNLYRMINNITPEKEKKLQEIMYSNDSKFKNENSKTYKIFYDIEDINFIKDRTEYAVAVQNGINLYEGLQNRQDACVKINLLYDENIWCKAPENLDILEREYDNILKIILLSLE